MLPFLYFIFRVFNPQKSVQLFGLEMAVGYWLLSLEFEVGTFDLHLHSLQTNKQNNTKQKNHHETLTKPKHLQCEDFVPFWIEVLVDGMCQQSVIIQFNYTKWVTFTYEERIWNKFHELRKYTMSNF